jgi:hypothetical protein
MEEQMDKTTLLDKIRTRQAEFEALLATLNEDQLTTPGVNGDWSIKDILAHLVAWQKRTLAYLDAAARQGEPGVESISSDAEMNDLNARFYAGNKSRPLADVMTDFKNTSARVVAAVEALSADDLFAPDRFTWLRGDPLWEQVAGNTYEHIDEHIGSIQAWLAASHQA